MGGFALTRLSFRSDETRAQKSLLSPFPLLSANYGRGHFFPGGRRGRHLPDGEDKDTHVCVCVFSVATTFKETHTALHSTHRS